MQTIGIKPGPHKKKILLTSIAVGAAGVLGYLGWTYYQKRKKKAAAASANTDLDYLLKSADPNTAPTPPALPAIPADTTRKKTVSTPVKASAPTGSADFPLKKGSKGDKVRTLQQALIAKYGKGLLPRYGADGDFGTETINALKGKGLPTTIDESTFYVLTQGTRSNAGSIANELYQATMGTNFTRALAVLQKMSNTADYSAANEIYKTLGVPGFRRTIVTDMMATFSDPQQRSKIRFEFLRMGLQYNGDKWSLSGLGGQTIITIVPAIVWVSQRKKLRVPASVVLGNEISRKLDYTLFENQGRYFLVPTRCVRYL